MRAPPSPVSGLYAERYKIERLIGVGATAMVHLARDTKLGRAVALKILREELLQSAATGRFLREIRRTAGLHHPHILEVLDSGEHDGKPYVSFPYMEGGTLRTMLKREKSGLPFDRVVEIARPIAQALDYAHTRGLVHRDVKPENILFTDGEACLGDFGIARALELSGGETGSTSANTVRGTPAYMSPEQAAASPDLDGRSDVFSLACVLYEMVTGMQAYIGPTPEAVINQRFLFPPREVRVFRPTAPLEVDAVLGKAFSLTPVDRYRTATELVDALEQAIHTPAPTPVVETRRTPPGSGALSRKWPSAAIGAAIAAVAVVTAVLVTRIERRLPATVLDTTLIVLLPLERDAPNTQPWRDDDLLQEGLARWRGMGVVDQFQIADALRRAGPINTSEKARMVAASVGAGRYLRGNISALGNSLRVAASLYDASNGKPLYQAVERVPNDIAGAAAAYARLADSLLLRGASADSVPTTANGTRSLPAVQALSRAQLALDDWDLVSADSFFQTATIFDPNYARANVWLAQVRAWQGQPRTSWGTIAERAVAMSEQLTDRERRISRALVQLARGSYENACMDYDALLRRNKRDFAAWFGLGQCQTMNNLVERDDRSPSGWRFRMSIQKAMRAYRNAFEILPSVHRGYERGAFQSVRVILLLAQQTVQGYGLTDSALFQGRLGVINDTLVLVPYTWRVIAEGKANSMPPGFAQAQEQRRVEFRSIAASWSAAFPSSSGAKQAVALALEMLGDPTAIDTMRVARRLATERTRRLELAAAEVLLLVRFGTPDRPEFLANARGLADSMLATRELSSDQARALIASAALLGRCQQAAALSRQASLPAGQLSAPPRLYVEAQVHLIDAILGCPLLAPALTLKGLGDLIANERARRGADASAHLDGYLLYRPALLRLDSAILSRLRETTKTRLIAAALYAAQHEQQRALTMLDSSDMVARDARLTPDIGLIKARLSLVLGDTARAIRLLDRTLAVDLRHLEQPTLDEAGVTASITAAIALRADLAHATGDIAGRRRWSTLAYHLLATADLPVQAIAQRMNRYTNMH